MPRRSLGALAAFVAGMATVAPVAAAPDPGPTLVIEGKGFGHGVGMPQDGAYAMAAAGASPAAILARFYPGTSIARRGAATVRVAVHESTGPVVVAFPAGGEVRDAPSGAQSPGFPVVVNPGGTVRLALDGGKYRVTPLGGAAITRTPAPPASPAPAAPVAAAPAPAAPATPPPTPGLLDPLLNAIVPTTAPPTTRPAAPPTPPPATVPAGQTDALSARGLWAVPKGDATVALPAPGRSFRGTVQVAAAGAGLQFTNDIDVEQYVRGMGEMPASWPAAALQAQAIAARTYAIRAAAAGRTLCDDQLCQVYIGSGNEHPATTAAAAATKGQVLTYQGALAEAVYSASSGGLTATAEEGFGPGSPDLPYLKPVQYPVGDPQLWATTLPLREAAARFGYRGELQDVKVTRTGPSGRPLEITFDGANGPMAIDAHRFFDVLQLRSTLFTLRTETAAPGADGEPLAAGTDLARFAGRSAALPGGRAISAAVPAKPLGRAPWVGLAVLLMAVWANAAHRARRPAVAVTAEAEAAPADEGPPA